MFALKMYSQNDKTDVLDSMQQNFLSCPNLKIFSMDFTIQWWYLCEFLEKKKKKRVTNLKISVSIIIRYSQNLREEIGN